MTLSLFKTVKTSLFPENMGLMATV